MLQTVSLSIFCLLAYWVGVGHYVPRGPLQDFLIGLPVLVPCIWFFIWWPYRAYSTLKSIREHLEDNIHV